jgi:serine/threonine protein kinase
VKKLHDINLIHRDLKPENLFLSKDHSKVLLIDFGSSDDLDRPEIRAMQIDDNYKRKMH